MILNKETVNIDICLDALVINNILATIKTTYLEIEVVLSNYSDTKFIIEGGFIVIDEKFPNDYEFTRFYKCYKFYYYYH